MDGILALDPAGPVFESNNELKLGKNDAKVVQVFHTNSVDDLPFAMGYDPLCGSVDFYFNGAKHQPGCNNVIKDILPFCHHVYGVHFLIALNRKNEAGSGLGYRNGKIIFFLHKNIKNAQMYKERLHIKKYPLFCNPGVSAHQA